MNFKGDLQNPSFHPPRSEDVLLLFHFSFCFADRLQTELRASDAHHVQIVFAERNIVLYLPDDIEPLAMNCAGSKILNGDAP